MMAATTVDAQAVAESLAGIPDSGRLAREICSLIASYRRAQDALAQWTRVPDELENLKDMRTALVAAQRKMQAPPDSMASLHVHRRPWKTVVAAFNDVVAPVLAEISEAEAVLQGFRPGRGNQGPDYNLDILCAGIVRLLRDAGDKAHTAHAHDIIQRCDLWGADGCEVGTFRRAVRRGKKWCQGPALPGSRDSVADALRR